METRHPVQDYFDCELPAICNHFGVMAARNRKSWKSVYFWCFLKKMTPYREIFKILFPKDSCGPTLINILRSNFVKFGWLEIAKAVHCLSDKKNKISPGCPAGAIGQIASKICQYQFWAVYSECSRFHPNRITFGRVIAEHVHIVETHHKVFPIFGWSPASSQIKMCYAYHARGSLKAKQNNFHCHKRVKYCLQKQHSSKAQITQ